MSRHLFKKKKKEIQISQEKELCLERVKLLVGTAQ